MEQRLRVANGLQAPGQARRFVVGVLREAVGREDVDTAALLVSELVTNAVLHAGSGCEVEVLLTGRVLRLSVLDDDPRPPVRRLAVSDQLATGRGLRLLEVMATRWGVDPRPGTVPGKVVWCEVAVRPDGQARR